MTTTPTDLKAVTTAKVLRLTGALAVQDGVPILQTFGSAGVTSNQIAVDVYNSKTEEGYQRDLQPTRVRGAAEYYSKGGRMPNPLLVNLRKEDFDKIEIKIDNDRAGYEEAIEGEGDWIGAAEILIPEDVDVWAYDGQHRHGAIKQLLASEGDAFLSFPVPLSMTIGLDASQEMKEFYEVNQNAKAVKTDLAWELLRRMAAEDPELAEALQVSSQDWKTKGADVTDELVALDGVWTNSIQEPNVRRVSSDRLVLNKAQFIRSLRPVLSMPILAKAEPSQVAKILRAYWEGIAKVLPEPFDPQNNPKKWVIQKGPGAISFHRLLPQVLEYVRATGYRLADPDAYAYAFRDLPGLSGEIIDEDGETHSISGADFWKSGPEGVASQWTGDAGRKRLAVRIQQVLHRASDELNL